MSMILLPIYISFWLNTAFHYSRWYSRRHEFKPRTE